MPTVIDLGGLGSVGSAITAGNDRIGQSVSAAGDVNGDGIDDVTVGGGGGYVVFGREGGIGDLDLAELQPSNGFLIDSRHDFGLELHPIVSGAGDINGDGFDDIIAAGYQYGAGAPAPGVYGSIPNAYVIFGQAGERDRVEIDDFLRGATSDGFRIFGEFIIEDYSDKKVAGAGDFNGDGFDDIILGVAYQDGIGAAYVVFGKASGFANIDLANLAPEAGFAILGANLFDHVGYSVSAAGDVNGDGLDDIIIGAPYANNVTVDGGEAYVIFGKESGFGTIDLSNLAPEAGFIIQGKSGSTAGWSVSDAGDVNGDGFDDVIVGAPYAEGDAGNLATVGAGEAYVIFGKAGGFGTIDLSKLKPKDGFTIEGDDAGDLVGWSVSGAGDLNSDGFDEIIVGAPGGDSGGADAGEAFVIFGEERGPRTIDLGHLEQGRGRADGFIIQGDIANERAGWSVSGAGDVDGDGVDDLIVGAPAERGDPNPGHAYILYGAQLIEFLQPFHGQGQGNAFSDLFW